MLPEPSDLPPALEAVARRVSGRLVASGVQAPIALMPREMPPTVLAALDAVPEPALPRLHLTGTPKAIRHGLLAALAESSLHAIAPDRLKGGLAGWLVDDISFLILTFQSVTGCDQVRVALSGVETTGRGFAPADTSVCLLTAYLGPGWDWLPPRLLATRPVNEPMLPDEIRTLYRGAVAILRGRHGANAEAPAVLLRSVQAAERRPSLRLIVEPMDLSADLSPDSSGSLGSAPN